MPKGVEHEEDAWARREKVLSVESLMPKGVEHIDLPCKEILLFGVESLMPKGVEH